MCAPDPPPVLPVGAACDSNSKVAGLPSAEGEAERLRKRLPPADKLHKCLRDPAYDDNLDGPCSAGSCRWPECKPCR